MLNNDYTRLTYQELLEDFTTRLKNDPRFAKMSSASIFYLFVELLTASMDMTNYYIQRTAEEAYLDTAKLDSSIIKLAHNLGYNPRRPVPAQAEFKIRIQGPLPSEVIPGSVVYFSRKDLSLSFNGNPFMLDYDYSYTFTESDINEGQSPSWSKTLIYSLKDSDITYHRMADYKDITVNDPQVMKIYQGEVISTVIQGSNNLDKISKNYQNYDIDDIEFSNWYGVRDPFASYKGSQIPMNGITKIGIGENKDSAFDEKNLYTIEDNHIYLNKDVIDFDPDSAETVENKNPKHICSITSNSDKTIRISFGDGTVVSNGISNIDENIYIEYVKTKGSKANKIGTKDSTLVIDSPIYCTQQGSVIDISNNIYFIFNSDIVGGNDFESAASIKINAPKTFGSRDRLVSLPDYQAYFSTLSTPINVKNSTVWSQKNINVDDTTYTDKTNEILYSITAPLYKCEDENYAVRNIFDDEDKSFEQFSLYGTGTDYLNHIPDYMRYLFGKSNYIDYYGGDYQNINSSINPKDQWQKNIKYIYDDIKYKIMIGTNIYSIAPIVHYYDVVGEVQLNSYKDMNSIKKEIEFNVYNWLNEHIDFNTPIYKSNILKFFNDNPNVNYADLDIKVSSLVKEDKIKRTCSETIQNETTFSNYFYSSTENNNYLTSSFNTIKIPRISNDNFMFYAKNLNNKSVSLNVIIGEKTYKINDFTPKEVNENQDYIFLSLNVFTNLYDSDGNVVNLNDILPFGVVIEFNVGVSMNNDLYSTSNFNDNNMTEYGLANGTPYNIICDIITQWVNESSVINSANRAITLPYYVEINEANQKTRAEEIMRRGTFRSTLDLQLSEKSFFQRLMPAIISRSYIPDVKYSESINFNELLTNDAYEKISKFNETQWNNISNLCLDIYKHVKATLSDSVLDDNNNIVNFTMPNEIPVIRLNITYKYRD